MTTVWIIIALVVAVALAVVAIYNGLVRGRNMVNEAWSGIDVQLKRRHEAIRKRYSLAACFTMQVRHTLRTSLGR